MKRWQIVLGGFIVAYGIAVLIARPIAPTPWTQTAEQIGRPLVIAHQGGDGLRPSNTMAAFSHAVELGVDVLEMDVHSTSDGVLVTIHDSTIDRTTNGSGAVQDFTFAELQTFDAGYNWPTLYEDPAFPYRDQGVTIPALSEILTTFPELLFNIELKQQSPSIAQDLCDLLREHNVADQALVASFHVDTIKAFRAACPEVATSLAQNEVIPMIVLARLGLGLTYPPQAHALQIPEERFGIALMKSTVFRTAHRKGLQLHAWTINEVDDLERILNLNVDGIITDYPDRMLTILENN